MTLGVPGCGPGRERGTLTGSVTFQGNPVTEGAVTFWDEDHAFFMTYPIQPNGTFEAATKEGKGIWAGTYLVTVAPSRVDPEMGVGKLPVQLPNPSNIPRKYWTKETSDLSVDVKEGANEPLEIKLTP